MFKKKPTVKPSAPLRSSDRRRLADQIIDDYRLHLPTQADPTPEQKAEQTAAHAALRNSLLPENIQSARFSTTEGPDLKPVWGTYYIGSFDGQDGPRVLWFQRRAEGRVYPSVYTLWKHADIVPLLFTPEIVVKKLQGGADLMTPGLAGGPPFPARAKQGEVVAIASTSNPTVPVAMGVCEIDVSALDKVQGAKGHAVGTMHWAGDELWAHGTNGKPGQPPPDEIEGWAKVLEEQGLTEKTESLSLEDDQGEDGGVPLNNGTADLPVSQADEGDVPEAEPLTQKEIDEAFRNAFLYGVYEQKSKNPSVKNHGLVFPLSQSFIMATLVQPYLPAFTPAQTQQLQIKKTSWKNIKKFIKSLNKDQLIKSKDNSGNETVILDIDFEDSTIKDFKPYRLPKKDTTSTTTQTKPSIPAETGGDDSIGQKLQVLSLYKPTAKLQPLFAESESTNPKQIFTPAEVRDFITAYIERESLISPTNKRLVKLNPTLGNAVFDGGSPIDREVLAKGSVPRDALVDRVLTGMAPSYAIQRAGSSDAVKPKSGAPPKIRITVELRNGKKVTRVSGLEPYLINARALGDELRKSCAGSTSVEALAGAAKKNEKEVLEVMVQGPQKEAVVKALEKRGVDKKWIEALDKVKKK